MEEEAYEEAQEKEEEDEVEVQVIRLSWVESSNIVIVATFIICANNLPRSGHFRFRQRQRP